MPAPEHPKPLLDLEDVLERVPSELRPLASSLAHSLQRLGEDNLMAFVDRLIEGDFSAAQGKALRGMTAQEVVEFQRGVREQAERLAEESAARRDFYEDALRQVVRYGLSLVVADSAAGAAGAMGR